MEIRVKQIQMPQHLTLSFTSFNFLRTQLKEKKKKKKENKNHINVDTE